MQSTSQEMFAWTVQDAVQLSAHSVVHSVAPGWTWQRSAHWVLQLAEHSEEQLSPSHSALHPASQSVEQYFSHVKVSGCFVHSVLHVVLQVSVQVSSAEALHIAEQVAVKLSGVHFAVHPPDVSKWQLAGSLIVTVVPPSVLQVVPASAVDEANSGAARASAAKETCR